MSAGRGSHSANRVAHVDIQGQRYAVRSDLDPAYIAQLAAYVDEKMRLAAEELQTVDAVRVAVIAGLNLADELFRARAEGRGAEGQIHARAAELERIVDAALDSVRTRAIAANS
jgi:cell division protein ZapA